MISGFVAVISYINNYLENKRASHIDKFLDKLGECRRQQKLGIVKLLLATVTFHIKEVYLQNKRSLLH